MQPIMQQIATEISSQLKNSEEMQKVLEKIFKTVPYLDLLYITDLNGNQISANTSHDHTDYSTIGQDLSQRPYLMNQNLVSGFVLSDVYISTHNHRPCLTATYPIARNGETLATVAGDFSLSNLPILPLPLETSNWRQVKGDPSIRGTLFMQQRTESDMDRAVDDIIDIIEDLFCNRGVFHAKLHYSGSRATLWRYNDPYDYRVHVLDEIIDPSVCLTYPTANYPERALVPIDTIHEILERFKFLRLIDDTIYLRSASLNIINGMIGLNFSCDGTHYMKANEFCACDETFWLGDTR